MFAARLSLSRKLAVRDESARALFRSGVARRLLRRAPGDRIVLLYHNPEPRTFARHLEFLAEHYEFRPVPGTAGSEFSDDRASVAITFDDGYRGVHTDLVPLLRQARVRAAMFVPTGFLGKRFGYEALKLALGRTPLPALRWRGRKFELGGPGPAKDAWNALCADLRLLAADDRDANIERLIAELEVQPEDVAAADVISRQEVAEMSNDLEIGSHTVTHPNLALLGAAELRRELGESKHEIEVITGKPCELFAYPIGRSGDYTPAAFDVLRECGYRRAFTAVPTTSPDSEFEYPRVGIGDRDPVETLCLKLSTLWPTLHRLLS